MKTRRNFIRTILALLLSAIFFNAFSNPMHTETVTFKVYGNCSMCKKTIETALKKNSNIKNADWNVESKMITVEYDPHNIEVDEIHKIIADAGYDTEKVKGNDTAYNKLMGCCKYKRAESPKSKKTATDHSGHQH